MFPPVLNSKPLMPVIPNQGFLHHRGYFCSTPRGEAQQICLYIYMFPLTESAVTPEHYIACNRQSRLDEKEQRKMAEKVAHK